MAIIMSNPLDGSQGMKDFVSVECLGSGRFGVWPGYPDPVPGSVYFSAAPDGTMALHCRVSKDDPLTYNGQRAEVAGDEFNVLGQTEWNKPLLYSWEMYIPSSWPRNGKPYTCMQIHDNPDAGSGGWPNVELMIMDGVIRAKIPANFYAFATGTGAAYDWLGAPVKFDRWVKCTLACKWDKTGDTGYMEITYDGKIIDGRYNTRTARADLKPPYSKFGVYDCLQQHDFDVLEAWYKNFQLRDGADGYVSVLGAQPAAINTFALSD